MLIEPRTFFLLCKTRKTPSLLPPLLLLSENFVPPPNLLPEIHRSLPPERKTFISRFCVPYFRHVSIVPLAAILFEGNGRSARDHCPEGGEGNVDFASDCTSRSRDHHRVVRDAARSRIANGRRTEYARARALAATISVHGDISTMDCVQSIGCPLIVLLFERGRTLLLSPSFSLFGKRERMKVDFHRENAARETNSILNILVRRK